MFEHLHLVSACSLQSHIVLSEPLPDPSEPNQASSCPTSLPTKRLLPSSSSSALASSVDWKGGEWDAALGRCSGRLLWSHSIIRSQQTAPSPRLSSCSSSLVVSSRLRGVFAWGIPLAPTSWGTHAVVHTHTAVHKHAHSSPHTHSSHLSCAFWMGHWGAVQVQQHTCSPNLATPTWRASLCTGPACCALDQSAEPCVCVCVCVCACVHVRTSLLVWVGHVSHLPHASGQDTRQGWPLPFVMFAGDRMDQDRMEQRTHTHTHMYLCAGSVYLVEASWWIADAASRTCTASANGPAGVCTCAARIGVHIAQARVLGWVWEGGTCVWDGGEGEGKGKGEAR